MRKAFIIVLGLVSLGALTQFAFAEQPNNCAEEYAGCAADAMNAMNGRSLHLCSMTLHTCVKNNADRGYNQYGERLASNKESKSGGGGGSKPKPGAHRTADGGIIMVTPEGKEWVWNGKYSPPVVTINRAGYQVIITVKQGDPDVTQMRYVNGQLYNIADPKYADAIAAEQAKSGGSKGGTKGGTKVGYHHPAGPISDGVTAFGVQGQSAPVGGSGAIATATTSNSKANTQNGIVRPKQNAINSVLNPAGAFDLGKPKLHAN